MSKPHEGAFLGPIFLEIGMLLVPSDDFSRVLHLEGRIDGLNLGAPAFNRVLLVD